MNFLATYLETFLLQKSGLQKSVKFYFSNHLLQRKSVEAWLFSRRVILDTESLFFMQFVSQDSYYKPPKSQINILLLSTPHRAFHG